MYEVQIMWFDHWITIKGGFFSIDDAEWAIALWKQSNQVFSDPFRVVEERARINSSTE